MGNDSLSLEKKRLRREAAEIISGGNGQQQFSLTRVSIPLHPVQKAHGQDDLLGGDNHEKTQTTTKDRNCYSFDYNSYFNKH